jgi:hypothetical protein
LRERTIASALSLQVQHKEKTMKTTVTKWATKAAGAGAIALLLATPSFAQSRGDYNRNNGNRNSQQDVQRSGNNQYGQQNVAANSDNQYGQQNAARNNDTRNGQWNNNHNAAQNNGYRENQRITASGKISSFSRERGGYRVQLDRGQSFWVPQATFGNRARDLRAGISISLGGIFRGGSVFVDAVTWPEQVGYGQVAVGQYGYNDGFVRGVVSRIDRRTGTALIRDDASGRVITADLGGAYRNTVRPGDYVQLTGQWIRGGVFDVARLDNVRNRRY